MAFISKQGVDVPLYKALLSLKSETGSYFLKSKTTFYHIIIASLFLKVLVTLS